MILGDNEGFREGRGKGHGFGESVEDCAGEGEGPGEGEGEGEGPELSRRYEVTAYPTMLILDAEGHELHRIVGYRSADALLEEVRGSYRKQ